MNAAFYDNLLARTRLMFVEDRDHLERLRVRRGVNPEILRSRVNRQSEILDVGKAVSALAECPAAQEIINAHVAAKGGWSGRSGD